MNLYKSNSETFTKQVVELTKILNGYRSVTAKIIKSLESLGYKVDKTKVHTKVFWNKLLVTTLSNTTSDMNASRQALRYIRKFWEEYEGAK